MKAVDQQSIPLDLRIQCLISSSNAVLIKCKGMPRVKWKFMEVLTQESALNPSQLAQCAVLQPLRPGD